MEKLEGLQLLSPLVTANIVQMYEGRSINKLQNNAILLVFQIWKIRNIHCLKKIHVTTSSMITWTVSSDCNNFCYSYYLDYRSSKGSFTFPLHLFCATALPWEFVEPENS